MNHFPPRLHVLLASHAQIGLVIRRGPSKCVATILWDRTQDQFALGQWLKGQIYPLRSDLSPDGQHFIYFAMNGKRKSETGGSWTAVSRVPYMKAIALYGKGDCWHGGGLWTNNTTYWLNDGYGHKTMRESWSVNRDTSYSPEECYGGECHGVYYARLQRDGWQFKEHISLGKWNDIDIFEKPAGHGWVLRKISHGQVGGPPGKGCYWDEHELVAGEASEGIKCPDWEWADMDGKRLVWAAAGKLFAAQVYKEGVTNEKMLNDFGKLKFEAIKAPY